MRARARQVKLVLHVKECTPLNKSLCIETLQCDNDFIDKLFDFYIQSEESRKNAEIHK